MTLTSAPENRKFCLRPVLDEEVIYSGHYNFVKELDLTLTRKDVKGV